jgi:hypothetical protein
MTAEIVGRVLMALFLFLLIAAQLADNHNKKPKK